MTTIAKTLFSQLGNQTFAMLGSAGSIVATERGLMFAVKGCRAGNKLVIELAANDTYTVALWKVNGRKAQCDKVRELEGVYADALLRTIESLTGLRTRLF